MYSTYLAVPAVFDHFVKTFLPHQTLGLEKYMLYAHGSDLCHDAELRHAMANCFEAVMGAVFLDGGIEVADRIFAEALFGADPDLHHTWTK